MIISRRTRVARQLRLRGVSGIRTLRGLHTQAEIILGREIKFGFLPSQLESEAVHGLWVRYRDEPCDWILTRENARPLSRAFTIGHELTHIFFRDDLVGSSEGSAAEALDPSGDRVTFSLARVSFSTPIERRAEAGSEVLREMLAGAEREARGIGFERIF